jgi:transaldolase/glucose-6-phosphate isomerase
LGASVEADVKGARRVLETLSRTGISLEAVTDRLLEDGVTQFSRTFDTLLAALGKDRGERLDQDVERHLDFAHR